MLIAEEGVHAYLGSTATQPYASLHCSTHICCVLLSTQALKTRFTLLKRLQTLWKMRPLQVVLRQICCA